jgi:hypothetical protein
MATKEVENGKDKEAAVKGAKPKQQFYKHKLDDADIAVLSDPEGPALPNLLAGTPGDEIGTSGTQPPIGAYVQDTAEPTGSSNYIGAGLTQSVSGNAIGAIGTTVPSTVGATQGAKTLQWVQMATGQSVVAGDKVTIAAGVATKDNAAGTHTVKATAGPGDYLWVAQI